jgi:hypothetical protein
MSTVIIPQHRSHLNKNPQIPKRAKPNRIASPAIKSDFEKHATCLVPLMLERKGYADEIFYTAECASCGLPILDFRMANVSTVGESEDDLIPIGKLGGAEAFRIPSEGAFVFHKECDETGRSPWVGAHCVFKNDQRYAFEKRGAA